MRDDRKRDGYVYVTMLDYGIPHDWPPTTPEEYAGAILALRVALRRCVAPDDPRPGEVTAKRRSYGDGLRSGVRICRDALRAMLANAEEWRYRDREKK